MWKENNLRFDDLGIIQTGWIGHKPGKVVGDYCKDFGLIKNQGYKPEPKRLESQGEKIPFSGC